MNVVVTSGWLEYFAEGPRAGQFAPAMESPQTLLVPAIMIYEIFKRVWQLSNADEAEYRVVHLMQPTVVDATSTIALEAAVSSLEHQLPMADAMILAAARAHEAVLRTMDADFGGLPGVKYIPKR